MPYAGAQEELWKRWPSAHEFAGIILPAGDMSLQDVGPISNLAPIGVQFFNVEEEVAPGKRMAIGLAQRPAAVCFAVRQDTEKSAQTAVIRSMLLLVLESHSIRAVDKRRLFKLEAA